MRTQKPTPKDLQEFARTHAWEYQMHQSNGLDSFDNYAGESLGDLVVVVGCNRDSDILAESNFATALQMLGGEGKNVEVHRFGHWGCGWFELILVNPKAKKHLRIAYDIHVALREYPVLDESDYSERQYESQSDYAAGAQNDLAEALALHFGLTNGRALKQLAYELNMECQMYAGDDSCIDVYKCREPDAGDIRLLRAVMDQLHMPKSRTFKKLLAAVNAFKPKESA